ncbi:MAG: hypothetical protein V4496_04870 [Pseudomonadota bacterium]
MVSATLKEKNTCFWQISLHKIRRFYLYQERIEMSAKIEKLTAALAEAKDIIRALKEDKRVLTAEFKEALKAVKSGAKATAKKVTKPAKKAGVKKALPAKTVAKKAPVVKKAKASRPKKTAPAPEIVEEKVLQEVSVENDLFPFGE